MEWFPIVEHFFPVCVALSSGIQRGEKINETVQFRYHAGFDAFQRRMPYCSRKRRDVVATARPAVNTKTREMSFG